FLAGCRPYSFTCWRRLRGRAGFGTRHRPSSRVLTWPNGNTHTTSVTYDHEGENTLVGGGSTLVTTVGYNDMGQLKRLALNNGLSTWYGYHGYEASANNDTYDAKEVTWNWGAAKNFGRLWRICTAAHANTRCQAANKDQPLSGQLLDMRHSYDNVGNVAAASWGRSSRPCPVCLPVTSLVFVRCRVTFRAALPPDVQFAAWKPTRFRRELSSITSLSPSLNGCLFL
ncbi:MAG: hypothetical protein KF770_14045, partial [Anaerolineae bacterium]|nr:hypothetical protein [Anaerolineae bacterium]